MTAKVTTALLASLLMTTAAHASDILYVSSIDCAFTNGVAVQAKESGKMYYNTPALAVRTMLFGLTKDFSGSSYFSVKPDGEVTVTLENKQHDLYFIRGFVDKKSEKEQLATLNLEKPGMGAMGSKTFLGSGLCKVLLKSHKE